MQVTTHVPDRILTLTNVLSHQECLELISAAENAGFKPSPPSGGGHGQTPRTGARTSQFYVKPNQKLANKLWDRIKDHVPKNLRGIKHVPYMNYANHGDEFTPIGVSNHTRYYKYNPGQYILKHDDYRTSRYRYDPNTNKYYEQMTFLTLLVYLNEEFQDGQTVFWTTYGMPGVKGHCRFIRDADYTKPDVEITPQTGMGLINDHMAQHEGQAPHKGIKYILRTDIVHEKEIGKLKSDTIKFEKGKTLTEWARHYEPYCINYSE